MTPPSPATVLVAAGDEAQWDILMDLIELEGYRVLTTDDGRAAVRAVARARPDLILADASLARPGDSLLAACAREWDLPLILLGDPAGLAPSDAVAVVDWPLNVPALLDLIAALTRRRIA